MFLSFGFAIFYLKLFTQKAKHSLLSASTHYQQALDIEIQTNKRNQQAKTYFQLGNIAEELMDMATAKDLYLKGLQISTCAE